MSVNAQFAVAFLNMGRPLKRPDEHPSDYREVMEAALSHALSCVVATPELDQAVAALRVEAAAFASLAETKTTPEQAYKAARARLLIAFDNVAFQLRDCQPSSRRFLGEV